MFELIFKAPRTLRRHRQGPLADERARYLAQLAEDGVSRSTLRHAAFFLLDFAARIDLRGDQKVSQEQIDRAADDWAHRKRPSEARPFEPHGSRERFRSVARAWLRFLGRWQPPQLPPQPYAHLITVVGSGTGAVASGDYRSPVSSSRLITRSVRISRTTRSCTLHDKGYEAYRVGTAAQEDGGWTTRYSWKSPSVPYSHSLRHRFHPKP